MSRQSAGALAGGVVGAAIGSFFPGGTAIGFSIGASLGNYLTAPDINTQGPRLSENTVTKSSYGVSIPRLYGCKTLPEIRIWSSGLIEHEHEEDVGKGGQSVTNTTYTYTASWACLLCEGGVNGICRIWFDGQLVYDLRDTAGSEEVYASIELASGLTFYPGSETQTIDPTIEAAEGVGNVSAYRGWAYLVFNNLDVTKYGHIPFVEVELYTTGSAGTDWILAENTDPGLNLNSMALYAIESGTAKLWNMSDTVYTIDLNGNIVDTQFDETIRYPGIVSGNIEGVGMFNGVQLYMFDFGQTLAGSFALIPSDTADRNGPDLSAHIPESATYVIGVVCSVDESAILVFTTTVAYADAWWMIDSSGLIDNGTIETGLNLGVTDIGFGSRAWYHYKAVIMESDRRHVWDCYGAGTGAIYTYEISDAGVYSRVGVAANMATGEFNFTRPSIIADNGFCWLTSGTYIAVVTRYPRQANTSYDLGTLVSDQCRNAGLVAADYDITDLTGTDVTGYSVNRQMSARSAIQPLQQTYFFDAAEIGGKIVFVSRGGASSNTLTDGDLISSERGELISITRGSSEEIPTRVTVNYVKPGDYEIGTQYDSRQVGVNT